MCIGYCGPYYDFSLLDTLVFLFVVFLFSLGRHVMKEHKSNKQSKEMKRLLNKE